MEPKVITCRLIDNEILLVELDDEAATRYEIKDGEDDGSMALKGIETVLTALGWIADLHCMYMDMNLMVLKFTRTGECPYGREHQATWVKSNIEILKDRK